MNAWTGSFLPLTMKGSSATALNATEDASRTGPVARIWPGTAIDITRAARFTASPITVYVRRYAGPMSPAKTCPLFTPIRTGTVVSASMIDRSVSSIRPSSSPIAFGAPATRMTLPPS